MGVLLDNGVPRGLTRYLRGHTVEEARLHGWEELSNGLLIAAAEEAGFDVLLTNDKNLRYQQNLKRSSLAIVVLQQAQWPMVKLVVQKIADAVSTAEPGSFVEVEVPFKR